eukprot:629327-Amphidinium_carterae.1
MTNIVWEQESCRKLQIPDRLSWRSPWTWLWFWRSRGHHPATGAGSRGLACFRPSWGAGDQGMFSQ